MKKSTIKLIAMLMAVVLMLPNFTGAGALNENEVDDGLLTWEEVEEIGRLEAPATKAYEEIMDAWTDEQGNIVYPDTFGGCYLDDNYMLVIKIADGDELLEQQIRDTVTDCGYLVFQEADISYSQLKELQKDVLEKGCSDGVISVSISQRDSVVDLHIRNENSKPGSRNTVKSNNQHIRITYVEESAPCSNTKLSHLNTYISKAAIAANVSPFPGLTIQATNGSFTGTGTIGWYGTYDFNGTPRDCILTAGHVVNGFIKLDANVTYSGITVVPSTYLEDRNYAFTSYGYDFNSSLNKYVNYGDAGYMTYKDILPTNKLIINERGTTVTIETWEVTRPALTGKTVYKGKGVSGGTSSVVANTDLTFETNFNGKFMDVYGMVLLDDDYTVFGKDGDSGAPIYLLNSSGKPSLCGIFAGEGSLVNREYYMTPTSLLRSAGFTPYLG